MLCSILAFFLGLLLHQSSRSRRSMQRSGIPARGCRGVMSPGGLRRSLFLVLVRGHCVASAAPSFLTAACHLTASPTLRETRRPSSWRSRRAVEGGGPTTPASSPTPTNRTRNGDSTRGTRRECDNYILRYPKQHHVREAQCEMMDPIVARFAWPAHGIHDRLSRPRCVWP